MWSQHPPVPTNLCQKVAFTTNNAAHPHTQVRTLYDTATPIETTALQPYPHPVPNLTLLYSNAATTGTNTTVADLLQFALANLGMNNARTYAPEFLQ